MRTSDFFSSLCGFLKTRSGYRSAPKLVIYYRTVWVFIKVQLYFPSEVPSIPEVTSITIYLSYPLNSGVAVDPETGDEMAVGLTAVGGCSAIGG